MKVVEIKVNKGIRYVDCKAEVKLENNNLGVEVVYPVQDDKHLTMLMRNKYSNRDVPHPDKFPIREAIERALK